MASGAGPLQRQWRLSMPRLADLLNAASGSGSPSPLRQSGTVIQTAQGPMVVLPDGRMVPAAGIPGVNGAMTPMPSMSVPAASQWQMTPGNGARG